MNELFIFIKPESSVRLSCLRDKVVGPDYRSVCMVPCGDGGDGAARRIITVLFVYRNYTQTFCKINDFRLRN